MPSKLPDNIRSLVIQYWLKGEQRDKIAVTNGLSAGAVTNIVNNWRQGLGFTAADELRDLAVTLKKVGITPAQCAAGFRVAMMMNRLGVKEDSFESFMSDVYSRCTSLGVTPENIALCLTDLLEFSKSIPISEIPHYIDQKKQEKMKLEGEIERLKEQMEDLKAQKSIAEELRDIALHNEKMTTANLKYYSDIREELKKYGIPVDDISQLAKVVNGIRRYGYDIQKVAEEFSNLQLLMFQFKNYTEEIAVLRQQVNSLKQERSYLQQTINSWNQTISACAELFSMGFGLKELKLLRNTISEIAVANNIPSEKATAKFFEDVDKQYDDKLGFESKLDKLQAEVSRLYQEEARLRSQILTLPLVSPMLIRLLQKGVGEQDIVDFAGLLENSGGSSSGSIDSSGVTIHEIRSLIIELRRYGSIKSTIGQLNQKVDKLRDKVSSLRAEKQDLDTQNEAIFSALQYSKQLVSFFSGSCVSLRNEILGLISIVAYLTSLLNMESERLQKVQGHISHPPDSEFLPLIMAAKGEDVDSQKIKIALVKAIEVTLKRLSGNNKLNEILSKGRLALLDDQLYT